MREVLPNQEKVHIALQSTFDSIEKVNDLIIQAEKIDIPKPEQAHKEVHDSDDDVEMRSLLEQKLKLINE